MNILLWVLQVLLAFFCLTGGGWKVFNRAKLPHYLPTGVWILLGVLELLGAFGLFVPALVLSAALILALEGLLLSVLYGSKSAKFSMANPMVYALLQLALAALIGYGRVVFRLA